MKHTIIIKIFPMLFLPLTFSYLNASDHSTDRFIDSHSTNSQEALFKQRQIMEYYLIEAEQQQWNLDGMTLYDVEGILERYHKQGRLGLCSLLEAPDFYLQHQDENEIQIIRYKRISDTLSSLNKSNSLIGIISNADYIYYSFTNPETRLYPLSTFIRAFVNKIDTPQAFELAVKNVVEISSITELEEFLKRELDNCNIQEQFEGQHQFISQHFQRASLSQAIGEHNETCYKAIMVNIGETLTTTFSLLEEILSKALITLFKQTQNTDVNIDEFIQYTFEKIQINHLNIQESFTINNRNYNLERDFLNLEKYLFRTYFIGNNQLYEQSYQQFYQNMRVFWSQNDFINDDEILSLAGTVQKLYYLTKRFSDYNLSDFMLEIAQ